MHIEYFLYYVCIVRWVVSNGLEVNFIFGSRVIHRWKSSLLWKYIIHSMRFVIMNVRDNLYNIYCTISQQIKKHEFQFSEKNRRNWKSTLKAIAHDFFIWLRRQKWKCALQLLTGICDTEALNVCTGRFELNVHSESKKCLMNILSAN